jgi:hypothetical protein
MPEWITPEAVAEYLGGGFDPVEPRLVQATAAARAAVERRRVELALDTHTDETAPADVRMGAIMLAALVYQQRSAPSGFDGYDAETALADAGAKRAEILRLLGWRRPVIA